MRKNSLTESLFSADILEFLKLLEANHVEYLIVGGQAVIYHGHARLTGDIDIFYSLSEQNAKALYSALLDFWDQSIPGIDSAQELMVEGQIIQFGLPPNRIDLINKISGIAFNEAWISKIGVEIKPLNIHIHMISLDNLIKNKSASGRPKDLDDLRYLVQMQRHLEMHPLD
jgi:hypothetical protein